MGLLASCTSIAESTQQTPTVSAAAGLAPTRSLPAEQPAPTSNPTTLPTQTAATPTPRSVEAPPNQAVSGDHWTSPVDQMDLVYIPAGNFRMGTLPEYAGAQPDEQPQRTVFLDAFWLDSTEVTWQQYESCEQAGACQLLSPLRLEWAEDDHPVVMVTWQDAANYCSWAGRRLPSEAEWEKGARGTEGRRYPWEWIGAPESGGELRLNFCDVSCPFDFHSTEFDDGYPYTAPVGSFPAGISPFGLFDMSGNVWEWTADWYQADRYKDKDNDLSQGPNVGTVRVIRGGSWLEGTLQGVVMTSRSANRAWSDPTYARPDLGFRCALSIQPPGSSN